VRIRWTGDWHTWHRYCALKRLRADLREIAEDDATFWFHGGDYAEFISPYDRRFDPRMLKPDMRVADLGQLGHRQVEFVRDLMRPIAGKCLGLMRGNHEEKYMHRQESQQLHGWLCEELAVPNMGYSTVFDLIFARDAGHKGPPVLRSAPLGAGHSSWRVRVFAHHGAGNAQTPGGKLNKLIRAMDYFPSADLVLMAHVHDEMTKRLARLDGNAKCTHIVDHEQVGAICGSYLRTYGEGPASYGEMNLYRPVCIGMTEIQFRPDKKRIQVLA